MNKILPLTNDVVMKMYFTRKNNEEQLKQFLKAVTHLTDHDLAKIEIENPQLPKIHAADKDFIVDINVTTKTGQRINIDVQVQNHDNFIERMVAYNARNYASQLDRGEDYVKLRESISIVITSFSVFNDCSDFFEHVLFRRTNQKVFTNAQQFYIIDLTKLPKKLTDAKTAWATLFKAQSKEELTMLSRDYEEISAAADKLIELSADDEVRYLADQRRKGRILRKMFENDAHERGVAKGHAEGHAEGVHSTKLTFVQNALANNLPLELIETLTGLSPEEIQALSDET